MQGGPYIAGQRTRDPMKYGPLGSAWEERERLAAAFYREDMLQTQVDDLEAERERLAAEVKHQNGWAHDSMRDRDRLREALEEIASPLTFYPANPLTYLQGLARRALADSAASEWVEHS